MKKKKKEKLLDKRRQIQSIRRENKEYMGKKVPN